MFNQQNEILGIDRNSSFALRVLILSVPSGLIFFILGAFEILSPLLAAFSYICILFFNTVFLLPLSAELQQIKKYINSLSSDTYTEELFANLTEKETRDITEAINSIHKFWIDKTNMLESRTLSDAAVLDTLPNPLLIVNQNKIILGANLAARNLFNAELNNNNINKFISDEKFTTTLQKIINHDSRYENLNLTLAHLPHRPKFSINISTLPWFAKGDTIAVISLYDLKKALQFEQIQQDFVANASHELRTPISIISGFIETLQTTAKDDEKTRDKFLHIIQEQTTYMSALIENLLSLSKIELSVNTPPVDKITPNTIIREIKSALAIKINNSNLKVTTKFAHLPQITADEQQITQVLQNLMDNAIKYAFPQTTISVTTAKTATIPPNKYYTVGEGEAVEISITNQGVSISPDDIEHLTERFYRLQEHKNQNIKGTGLGLSIAAQIIKRHHGNLIISSENGLTTFKVYLPVTQPVSQP